MNRNTHPLPNDESKATPTVAGSRLHPSAVLDPDAAGVAPVTEFLIPWLNAQGKIQMIQAYLC